MENREERIRLKAYYINQRTGWSAEKCWLTAEEMVNNEAEFDNWLVSKGIQKLREDWQ